MFSEWESHRQQLKSYINKKVDDPNIVEDILHDVYIKASANLKQLKKKQALKAGCTALPKIPS
ncbi:hypothetical protein [Pseudoalteromonas aliena]|uniref:hypothetical protein n=1 Tax=Pseudoalteromonas aliena TaxID=247523 RepID=UPI001F186026|nr:hypothetical protein [Pseudoalteromonas aliena]